MMSYEVKDFASYSIVYLTGEIDLATSPAARRAILTSLTTKSVLLVDLSTVEYIDSSGVASLVEGFQTARSKQKEFALVGVSNAAMNVFQLARLEKVFPIYKNVDEYMART